MRVKEGVILVGLQFEMRDAIISYFSACSYFDVEGEITSGLEGIHSHSSYHYYGYAVDFSIKGMDNDTVDHIVATMIHTLGPIYDVVLEDDHIHVEFDVKKAKNAGYKKEF